MNFKLGNKQLTEHFLQQTQNSSFLREAVKIVRSNSEGPYWILGGFVYRNIVASLYGVESKICDIDFIVKKINDEVKTPDDWQVNRNVFNGYKFIRSSDEKIDLTDFDLWVPFSYTNDNQCIENVLKNTPLDIQSIAFNIDTKEVIGALGIESILSQKVKVNSSFFAQMRTSLMKISVNEYILEKSSSLGFSYDPIDL